MHLNYRFVFVSFILILFTSLHAQLVPGVDFEVGVIDVETRPVQAYAATEVFQVAGGAYLAQDSQFPFFRNDLYFFNGDSLRLVTERKRTTYTFLTELNEGAIFRFQPQSIPLEQYFYIDNATLTLTPLAIRNFTENLHFVTATGYFLFLNADNELMATDGSSGMVTTLRTNVSAMMDAGTLTVNGKYLFRSDQDLYITDGENTQLIAEDVDFTVAQPTVANGKVFYTAGGVLYSYSDDPATITALNPTGPSGSPVTSIRDFKATNNGVVFAGNTPETGSEIWYTDGSEAGTGLLRDFAPGAGDGAALFGEGTAFSVGSHTVFVVRNEANEREVWTTDGTPAGTFPLPLPSVSDGDPTEVTVPEIPLNTPNGKVFFQLSNASSPQECWYGTNAGTETSAFVLMDSLPSSFPLTSPTTQIHHLNNKIVLHRNGTSDLWVLEDPGSPLRSPGRFDELDNNFTVNNGILYFRANQDNYSNAPEAGTEVYRTDGTIEGTFLLQDIVDPDYSSTPFGLVRVQDSVYFHYNNLLPDLYEAQYVTDGTTENTRLKADLFDNTGYANISGIRPVGNKIVVTALSGLHAYSPDTDSLQALSFGGTLAAFVDLGDGKYLVGNRNDLVCADF
ncbi:MAG: hypothetical protein AAF840_10385, partial [Bacteroidota bacterium]